MAYKLKDPDTTKPKEKQEVNIIEDRETVVGTVTLEKLEENLLHWQTMETQASENITAIEQQITDLNKILK